MAVMGGSKGLEIRSCLVRPGFRRRLSLGGKGGMVICVIRRLVLGFNVLLRRPNVCLEC